MKREFEASSAWLARHSVTNGLDRLGARARSSLVSRREALRLALGCSTLALGCGSAPRPGRDAPAIEPLAFDLPRVGGGRLDARALRGRPVVLKALAAWCEPCRRELPLLSETAARLPPTAAHFIGLSLDPDEPTARRFIDELGIRFPVVLDPSAATAESVELRSLEDVYLFDGSGRIVVRYARCDKATAEDLLRRLTEAHRDGE